MDFNDTPEEALFRAEVRAFLDANASRKSEDEPAGRSRYNEGPEALARGKAWQAKKAAAGFAGITWDPQWGGRGGTPIQQVIYSQEEANYNVSKGYFDIGLGMCIPTLMTYGKPDQLERHVRPALRGEEIWCQLFSEPSAGSDVAGLRTRAERDGDDWVINGQKIWTSGAHYCDFGILLTRTDPNAPKHAGLTMFFLDMKSPGVEVRRIKQISGTSNFNEVFFTNVRIPDAQRLGAVGAGWKVSITTLMNERLAVGEAPGPDSADILKLVRALDIDGEPALSNPAVRERLADWYVKTQGLKFTRFRSMTALSRGQTPGPEASIAKVISANKLQEIASFGIDLLGQSGAVMDPELAPMQAWFQEALLYAPGMRIAGGTDEILRNIIAERVLGLPGDVRVDKTLPFSQLPQGGAKG
ncbi:MAG: acyl-CoA dehydrogenase family protein [Burkholderiales bacterium]|nr:acyl-CoA dehydrogenase family protein [Burkholderiales bacterium]